MKLYTYMMTTLIYSKIKVQHHTLYKPKDLLPFVGMVAHGDVQNNDT